VFIFSPVGKDSAKQAVRFASVIIILHSETNSHITIPIYNIKLQYLCYILCKLDNDWGRGLGTPLKPHNVKT